MRDYKCIIKELGLEKYLDVTSICNMLDISRTTYYNVINNKKEPSVSIAIHITRELNHSLIGIDFHKYLEIEDLFVPAYIRDDVINGNIEEIKRLYPTIAAYIEFIKNES